MRLGHDKILYHTGLDSSYIPVRVRRAVLERDGYKCRFCKKSTRYVCHDLPKCRRGKTEIGNLLACCRPCSRKKDMATAEEYYQECKERTLLSVEDIFKDMRLIVEIHLSSGKTLVGEIDSPIFFNQREVILKVEGEELKINVSQICSVRELWGKQKRKEAKPVEHQGANKD